MNKIFKVVTWATTGGALLALVVMLWAWRNTVALESSVVDLMQECVCTVAHPVIGEPLAHAEWVCESMKPWCERSTVAEELERFDEVLPAARDVLVERAGLFFLIFSVAATLWLLQLLLFALKRFRR